MVGEDILGRFYRKNSAIRTKPAVQANAIPFFRPYRYMVRPIQLGRTDMAGTISDGSVRLCASGSGLPWGIIVFVRTGEMRNAVLLPCADTVSYSESVATYYDFLKNDHELIHVHHGTLDEKLRQWTVHPDRLPMTWPKSEDSYPSR
jgi:hypothetical protein